VGVAVTVLAAALAVLTACAARVAARSTRASVVRRRLGAQSGAPVSLDARTGAASVLAVLPDPPSRFERALDHAGFEVDARLAWWSGVGGVGLVGLVAIPAAGAPLALLATSAAVVGSWLVLRSRRGQGDARLERALPEALEAAARSLRSGASLRQAIAEAAATASGRLGRELEETSRQVVHGATLIDALEALAERRPVGGVRLAVAALCLAAETGGAQARAVDGVAATLRDRLAIAAEVRALSSQARISALVIGLAPLAFGAFAVTTDPRTGRFLFHTPVGLVLLAVGVSLDGLGWLWMQRVARVAV
jgi:tight adherence protein B